MTSAFLRLVSCIFFLSCFSVHALPKGPAVKDREGLLQIRQAHHGIAEKDAKLIYEKSPDSKPVDGYFSVKYFEWEAPQSPRYAMISTTLIVDETMIKSASVDLVKPTVLNITLTDEGGKRMTKTTLLMPKGLGKLAVMINGKVHQIATLHAESLGSRFQISGLLNPEEAKALEKALLLAIEQNENGE